MTIDQSTTRHVIKLKYDGSFCPYPHPPKVLLTHTLTHGRKGLSDPSPANSRTKGSMKMNFNRDVLSFIGCQNPKFHQYSCSDVYMVAITSETFHSKNERDFSTKCSFLSAYKITIQRVKQNF